MTEPDHGAQAARDEGVLDLPAALRALRRRADLSQRELAEVSGVPAGTIGRIESGASTNPTLRTVERLVRATGARLAVLDLDGAEPAPLDIDALRDRGGRHAPAHLDPYQVTWRGARYRPGIGFARHRRRRDARRRERAGERLGDLRMEIRRLGPGDVAVLRRLPDRPDPDPERDQDRARRYLRDPAVRHWVAEEFGSHEVLGHLAAHLRPYHAGRPAMVVTEMGLQAGREDEMVGPWLVAALCHEAERIGAGEIVAVAADRSTAALLRGLGFVPHRSRRRLLSLPE